jgi:hypothetical protein
VIWTGLFLYLLRLATARGGGLRATTRRERTMKRKGYYLLGVVLLVAFAGFAFASFQDRR